VGTEVGSGEEEAPAARRGLTAIEFLEEYSGSHPETIEELLEWPYRRVLAAMDAWKRRQAAEEIDKRRLAHIGALYTKDFDPEKINISDVFEQVEEMYDRLKEEATMSEADRKRIDEVADTAFMRASRRAVARSIEYAQPDLPGMKQIRELPDDPGDPWE
jgi:hypothetical protein